MRSLFVILFFVGACSSDSKEEPPKEEKKEPPKEVKKEPPKEAPKEAAKESKPAPPAPKPPAAKKADVWDAYPGPDIAIDLPGDKKHWAAIPISTGWDSLKITQLDYKGAVDGKYASFGFMSREFHVPSTFVRAAEPAKVKVGDKVLLNVYVTSTFGRIAAIKGDKVVVEHHWVDKVEPHEVASTEVVLLAGALEFGSPVAYKKGKDWHAATLLHKGDATSWLLGFGGKPVSVPTGDIKPVGVSKTYNAGDKVWARFGSGQFMEAKVVKVLDGGLRYATKFDFLSGAEPTNVGYAHVTTGL